MIVKLYILLHLALLAISGWLLARPSQPLYWRAVLGLIAGGALWNLAGLIWLGYPAVWPGEPIITPGFCLLLLGIVFAQQPIVTRHQGP